MTNGIERILIVEDQPDCLEALEWGVKKVFPEVPYDLAKCLCDATRYVQGKNYSLVLLDNKLPYDIDGTPDYDGYRLIPLVRATNLNTRIAGTSSLSDEELIDLSKPDFKVRKNWMNTKEDLEKVLSEIQKMKGGMK